ncbi:MAG: hypothetical protein F4Z01_10105 [Gammaproteobacteria bacterium]|nr:hypothetical protein [Gammaproteobacteria bacterium]MYF38383.1 hypothetical protein [Gammaproteobacteria bacterium]
MKVVRVALLALVTLSMLGCSTVIVRRVDMQPPKQASEPIPEDQLLDVGIVVFDPNIPEDYDDIIEANITPEVRRAEANWIANYTKDYLQATGNWGAVRAIPEPSLAVDLLIRGRIVHSNGERQVLEINVTDSRGVVWIDEVFDSYASKYSYEPDVPAEIDPFQTNYKTLSNKLLEYQESLSPEDIHEIRMTTLVRYGKEIVPEAFGDYVIEERDGRYTLKRIPSSDDPTMGDVRLLLVREQGVIDQLDEYFDQFANDMEDPYRHWREGTYGEAIAMREELARSKARLRSGIVLAVISALAQRQSGGLTEIAGYAGVIGGATEILGGIQDRANAKVHQERLQELGDSAGREISPMIIQLENSTISTQGTYAEQFARVIEIIRKNYQKELGNIPEEETPDESIEEDTTDEFIPASE